MKTKFQPFPGIPKYSIIKICVLILFIFISRISIAQNDKENVISTMKEFHQALVNKDKMILEKITHPDLSYGHSNGWLESRETIIKDNQTGYLVYESYKEDSLNTAVLANVAYIRFIADIRAGFKGQEIKDNHLKVVEVWVKENESWKLLVRQAVR